MPLNNQNMSATKERDESLSDVATANLFNAARRRLYTPAVVEMMQQLAKENRTAAEIAVIIGSTPGCVRVKCSQFGIKLSQRGRRNSSLRKLTVPLGREEYGAIERRAAAMRKSPVELARLLLEAIVSSDLYQAVLDAD
jgi:hypothetical protein